MNRSLLAGAAAVLLAATARGGTAQELRTESAVRQLRGETDLQVNVRFGVGQFTLARETGGMLYRSNVVYDDRYFTPVNRYSEEDRTLEVGTRSRRQNLDDVDLEGQQLDVRVTPDVPVAVDMEFGAGRASIDLGGLKLERAEIATGASETTVEFSRPTTYACRALAVKVGAAEFHADRLGNSNCAALDVSGAAGSLTLDFSGEWQLESMAAVVNLGLGGLTLRFPRDLGVEIELSRFLASFDREGLVKDGNTYRSAGFDQAARHLRIELKAIVGDVSVEWIR